ncbi:hypothetical protein Poli38472_007220 [Pythium oligandrum]|uniref:BZIP domain-containing protein n=1 Tax=Pythium oligandrum TaxID=41045 RepID=A0A8K1CA40_PYTOL|nr:hypothetical protein Poli38472_007220 [Pythium oligandrum]|eukprot:TMW59075.1 hypothetical protein Poli38472_007220 [Pythium oligandrum]
MTQFVGVDGALDASLAFYPMAAMKADAESLTPTSLDSVFATADLGPNEIKLEKLSDGDDDFAAMFREEEGGGAVGVVDVDQRRQLSIERRRKRNREAMQRSRQRDKDYMEGLRQTAASLQKKHDELVQQMNERLAVSTALGNATQADLQKRLEAAREEAQKLKELNLRFKEEITERIKGEDRMEGLLKELIKEQERNVGTLSAILYDSMTPHVDEDRAMKIIMEARQTRLCIEKKRMVSCQPANVIFGWETRHCFVGKYMYMECTKTFRHCKAEVVCSRAWTNAVKMISYRTMAAVETQRWKVISTINEDTFLSSRDKVDPENAGEFVRLFYLRFRVKEPDGSYAIGTRTIREHDLADSSIEKLWANQIVLWTMFVPVRECDVTTGEEIEHCRVRFIGRTAFGDRAAAERNALETFVGLCRWENANVGPFMNLPMSS